MDATPVGVTSTSLATPRRLTKALKPASVLSESTGAEAGVAEEQKSAHQELQYPSVIIKPVVILHALKDSDTVEPDRRRAQTMRH